MLGRFRPVVLAIAVLLLLAGFATAIRPGVVAVLVTRDELRPSNAIVLAYAAGKGGAIHAADLYRAGLAPIVVVSDFSAAETPGVLTDHLGDLYARELEWRGVPPAAMRFLDGTPTSTEEEALAVRRVLLQEGYRQVILVTQSYRMRRTALSLRHHLTPVGIGVLASPVRPRDFDPDRWWETRQGVSTVANELPRVVYYFLRRRF